MFYVFRETEKFSLKMGQRYFFVSSNSVTFYAQPGISSYNEKREGESYVEGNGASVSDSFHTHSFFRTLILFRRLLFTCLRRS